MELFGGFPDSHLAVLSPCSCTSRLDTQKQIGVGDGNNIIMYVLFPCGSVLLPKPSCKVGSPLCKAVMTKREAYPSHWEPFANIQIDFIYMEEMLSRGIYPSNCVCIRRIVEVHTCAKVTRLIYIKDKIRVLEQSDPAAA